MTEQMPETIVKDFMGRISSLDADLRAIGTCKTCGKPIVGVGDPKKVGLCVCKEEAKTNDLQTE